MYHGSMASGGQGVYLSNLGRELAALGHQVHVISGPPYPDLHPAVHDHRLQTYSFQSMLLDRRAHFRRPPVSLLHPFNFYEFASTRFTLSALLNTFSVRALIELRRLERECGPFDIVHDNQTLAYGTLATRTLLGLPVVANVHHPLDIDARNGARAARSTPDRIRRTAWYPWRMQRIVARRLDALISGSEASARLVEETWALQRGAVRAIYDGVDTALFRPAGKDETEPGCVLFVGNSDDPNKGAVFALQAIAALPSSLGARLCIVGGPAQQLSVAPREIERLGIEDRVTIVGRVSSDELAAWYRRAQVVVCPSLYEGFGLPAAEAMACGTAVIASDGGALPEVVADRETGVIVPAGDAPALADALAGLIAGPDRCRAMGAAGRARVLERFTWSRTATETAQLYEQVLAARATLAPSP